MVLCAIAEFADPGWPLAESLSQQWGLRLVYMMTDLRASHSNVLTVVVLCAVAEFADPGWPLAESLSQQWGLRLVYMMTDLRASHSNVLTVVVLCVVAEFADPGWPLAESLSQQWGLRLVYMMTDLEDDRLSPTFWLAAPTAEEFDTEQEMVSSLNHKNIAIHKISNLEFCLYRITLLGFEPTLDLPNLNIYRYFLPS